MEEIIKKIENRINIIQSETWYVDSGQEAKQSCIEEFEKLIRELKEEK